MSAFEYVSVLVSIVLALGIAHILGGLSSIARSWDRVRLYPVQLVWSIWLLVVHVQIWWAYWDHSGVADWNFFRFSSMLILPSIAYLAARLIMPDVMRDEAYDLEKYFYAVRVAFFTTISLFWAVAVIWRKMAFGDVILHPRRIPQAFLVVLALSGALVASRTWQVWLVVLAMIVWLVLIVVFRLPLGAYA